MPTIDDLRRTLDDHAAGLSEDSAGRRAAVHQRVGVVRRRRRVGAAGAAVLGVAALGGVLLLPGSSDVPQPAHSVVGVPAPDELTALGYRYEFAEGVDGEDGRATLDLEAASEPRLVTWATSADAQDVRVAIDSGTPRTYRVPDFGDWVLVPAGVAQRTTVRAGDGEAGLAVYALTDDRPDGVTRDGITFRDQVAGSPLLGAAVGDPGQAEVTVDLSRFSPGLDLRYFCSGGPADAYLHADLGEGGVTHGSGCDTEVPVDPAAEGDAVIRMLRGEDPRIRLSVTRGPDGPLVEDPDLRIGLGAYAADAPAGRGDVAFPALLEQGGHLYRLVEQHASESGEQGVEARVMDGASPVLVMVGINARDVTVNADFGSESHSVESHTGTRGGSTTGLASPGELVSARLESFDGSDPGTLGPGDSLVLGFYERAD